MMNLMFCLTLFSCIYLQFIKDWLMWFAAFQTYEYNPWLLGLSAKFLLNDKNFTSQMIAMNPFEDKEKPK